MIAKRGFAMPRAAGWHACALPEGAGALTIIILEGVGEVLQRGKADRGADRGNASGAFVKQHGRRGHAGLGFLLTEGLTIKSLQPAFGLPRTAVDLAGQVS